MKRSAIALALLMMTGAANAGLSFVASSSATRSETFDGIAGISNKAVGSILTLGELDTDQAGTITFTYLGQESAYLDKFYLLVNGTQLTEGNAVGTAISAAVTSLGPIGFKFEGNTGNFAVNGSPGCATCSIGLIGQNLSVTSGAAAGNYAFVLGYNDSAGTANMGDWDDFVVGVNYVTHMPEPETYAMMFAGLGILGFARRRKQPATI